MVKNTQKMQQDETNLLSSSVDTAGDKDVVPHLRPDNTPLPGSSKTPAVIDHLPNGVNKV